jgi:hypothetical protein
MNSKEARKVGDALEISTVIGWLPAPGVTPPDLPHRHE